MNFETASIENTMWQRPLDLGDFIAQSFAKQKDMYVEITNAQIFYGLWWGKQQFDIKGSGDQEPFGINLAMDGQRQVIYFKITNSTIVPMPTGVRSQQEYEQKPPAVEAITQQLENDMRTKINPQLNYLLNEWLPNFKNNLGSMVADDVFNAKTKAEAEQCLANRKKDFEAIVKEERDDVLNPIKQSYYGSNNEYNKQINERFEEIRKVFLEKFWPKQAKANQYFDEVYQGAVKKHHPDWINGKTFDASTASVEMEKWR